MDNVYKLEPQNPHAECNISCDRAIKIKAPAKINLTLKVGKKRHDGFHPIESVMQTVSLYDYITLKISHKAGMGALHLSGNSDEIPYDDKNIAHKAAALFLQTTGMAGVNLPAAESVEVAKLNYDPKQMPFIDIYIEKNIPICAGLAGGSTDAAAVLYGLNKLFDEPLARNELHILCAKLGSDLNFCLEGGLKLTKGRGEILTDMEFQEFPLTIVKPKNLKISTKEAYDNFDKLNKVSNMQNDLEFAMTPYHPELAYLSALGMQMSGSGPSFFIKKEKLDSPLDDNFYVFENLKSIQTGVIEV